MAELVRFQRNGGARPPLGLVEKAVTEGQRGQQRLVHGALRIGGDGRSGGRQGAIEVADLQRQMSDQRRAPGIAAMTADVAPGDFEGAGNAASGDMEIDQAVGERARRRQAFDRLLEQGRRLVGGAALQQGVGLGDDLTGQRFVGRLRRQAGGAQRQAQGIAHSATPATADGTASRRSAEVRSVSAIFSRWAAR